MANENSFKTTANVSHHDTDFQSAVFGSSNNRGALHTSQCGPMSSTPIPIMWSLSDSSDTEDLSISSELEDEELAKYMDLHSLNMYRRACAKLDCMKEGDELRSSECVLYKALLGATINGLGAEKNRK